MSIRNKLILTLSSLLIVAFVSTSLISFMVSKNLFRTSVIDETLPLISNNILSEVQRDLMIPTQVSSLMAHDTFLKDWTLAGEESPELVVKYLREIREKYGFFTTFFVSEKSGRYYFYNGILKVINPEDAHDVWYYGFRDRGKEFELDVDTNEAASGTLTVFINHRLLDYEGRFLGVAGVGLNMDQVGRIMTDYQAKYHRMVYMVDSKGLIQVHPDRTLIEKVSILEMEGIGSIAPALLQDHIKAATFEFDRGGKHMIVTSKYFPKFDWHLIVEHEETKSLQAIRSVMFTNLGVGLLSTCIIIIIVVLAVNHFQGRLEYMATVDDLTNVTNRRQFMKVLKAETTRAIRYSRPLSMLMIDVDHFKSINDTYGHPMGDRALILLADTIKGALRESDLLGRLGGEEFGAMLPEIGKDLAAGVADRIREKVASTPLESDQGTLNLTISIGVAAVDPHSGVEDLLRRADQALYQAKESGRNRVCKAA